MSNLRIYDSLSRSTVEFTPKTPQKVTIYACGLTPQAPAHLGHMRGAVFFDVVRRWFEHLGYEVEFVQNFTDIDDKIIRKSQEEQMSPADLAKKYEQRYLEDLELLNVKPAKWVYVTENMPVIIEMIERIIENGHAYTVDGDVYFRVTSLEGYGKLSHRRLEDMQAGARIEVDERKEHPMDFALWKAAKPGEPAWESPWGKGRPGWHIECSALSLKELGPDFDIHAGGVDLIFPHHENEIAQSEAYLGGPHFARIWMHWGSVQLSEKKMSKSEGNVMSVREAIGNASPNAVRLLLLNTGYRAPIDYSESRLHESQTTWQRIENSLTRIHQKLGDVKEGAVDKALLDRFSSAMNNDFNTPSAIAVLHETIGRLNEILASGTEGHREEVERLYRTAFLFINLLGLKTSETPMGTKLLEEVMQKVIEWRQVLRNEKQFSIADKIRDDLESLGITLEDSVEGTTWRPK